MQTEKIYDKEPYTYIFTAMVLSCEEQEGGFAVTLDRTAFFHEGGGQPCDTGMIGDARVTYVYESGGEIYHICTERVFGEVECAVDGAPRFMRMQHHSAEHIVCGIVHSLFGYDNIGFHLNGEGVTFDIDGHLSSEELSRVERLANETVWKNLCVSIRYPDKDELEKTEYRSKKEIEGRVRLVYIENTDICACCAPHVSRTGDIGLIKLLDAMNYKGGMRIRLLAGSLALADYEQRYNDTYNISVRLSAKQNEVVCAVSKLTDEINSLKAELSERKKELCALIIEETEKTKGNKIRFYKSLDSGSMRNIVNACSGNGMCAVFSGTAEGGYDYIIAGGGINLRSLVQDINKTLDARGGGNEKMIQGHINQSEQEIRDYFERIAYKSHN